MTYASLAGRTHTTGAVFSPPFVQIADVIQAPVTKTQSGQPIDSVDLSWSLRPSGSPLEEWNNG